MKHIWEKETLPSSLVLIVLFFSLNMRATKMTLHRAGNIFLEYTSAESVFIAA